MSPLSPDLALLRAALRGQLAAAEREDWAEVVRAAATVRAELARPRPQTCARAAVLEVAHLQIQLDGLLARRVAAQARALESVQAAHAYSTLSR